MTPARGRVWVTRARPGAEATAARVSDLGFEPVVEPLLEIRDRPWTAELADVGALAFTSRNGVAAFARASDVRDLPAFAVGDATAAAARQAGFRRVESAEGAVDDLAALIAGRRDAFDGVLLHPAASEPAGDLAAPLARARIAVRTATVYESLPRAPDASALAALDQAQAVLLHSPKAARALAAILAGRALPQLRALCLSPAVAAPLAAHAAAGRIGPVSAAPRPDETALLALLAP